jgi:hypothetical protein
MILYNRKILVEVLTYHWATNASGCGCGWHDLGKSHAEHVATIYEDSILIRNAGEWHLKMCKCGHSSGIHVSRPVGTPCLMCGCSNFAHENDG